MERRFSIFFWPAIDNYSYSEVMNMLRIEEFRSERTINKIEIK